MLHTLDSGHEQMFSSWNDIKGNSGSHWQWHGSI